MGEHPGIVEHTAWVGPDYEKSGIEGQRVAIVGYSHWLWESHVDTDEGTRHCIRKVIAGQHRIAFFTQIRNYFGFDNHAAFWPCVMFFNYLPNSIGGAHQRFNQGTPEQIIRARSRFRRLITDNQPDKVLVLTSRHGDFPQTDEPCQPLPDFPRFKWGIYRVGDHIVRAFFLRHPQGAKSNLMRRAVTYALDTASVEDNPT
jgi:hypothetical protein